MGNLKGSSQKNTNMIARGSGKVGPETNPDGRIGSPTPASYTKPVFEVNNNQKAGQPSRLGGTAASTMSASHSGNVWSPRAAKARGRLSESHSHLHERPINLKQKTLKRVKPT